MNDTPIKNIPVLWEAIRLRSQAIGFGMPSDLQTGSLLATLAASKPEGRFLELGTGTGLSTTWILSGMDVGSHLDSLDAEEKWVQVARDFLGNDSRVKFIVQDGVEFLTQALPAQYDFIFADTWPGKFTHLDLALGLLKPGGLYVIDDLFPQPNWPEGHAPKVPRLIEDLESRSDFHCTKLGWSTGLMVVTKKR
jgi:predicted O-methyltransferase YrrM